MTRVALCFTGQARTVETTVRKHVQLIDKFRRNFNTYAIGLTDTVSTYAVNNDAASLGIGHYDIVEPLPMAAITSMKLDRLVITDETEWTNALHDFKLMTGTVTPESHVSQLLAQFWKYKKVTSLMPDCDIYIKLRWDVKYNDESVNQMISNVNAIIDKNKYTIPPMAEVFVSGLYIDPAKGLRFQDYSPIYASKKAQQNFNDNIIQVISDHMINDCNRDLTTFDFINVWKNAFVSAEKNIALYNVPYNKTFVDSIIRPEWYENISAKETWHLK